MKHNYLKSLFLMLMMCVGMSAWGETLTVDFESETSAYTDWTFTNFTSKQTNKDVTAQGGSYFGTTGGTQTGSLQTKEKIVAPSSIVCYVSKVSTNTTSSTWKVQVSSNGTSWTDVKSQSATSMNKGTWVEFSADLSSYSNVYVRIYYTGSTAVRCIDDVTFTYSNDAPPAKTLTSIAISGTPNKVTYKDGDTFDPTGLVVTGTYDDGGNGNLTAQASFTCTPSAMTLGVTSVSVKATVGELSSAAYDVLVTVKPNVDYVELPWEWAGGVKTDLTAIDGVTGYGLGSDYALQNAPYRVKFDGDGDYIQVKTNEPIGVCTIKVKVFEACTSSKILVKGSADGTNFTTVEELTITAKANETPELSTSGNLGSAYRYVRFEFKKQVNVGIGGITIAKASEETPAKEVSSISVTGTPAEFWKGDAFNNNGMTVTATYDDGSNEDVTSKAAFSGYNMATAGAQTVTVTYGGKTDTYEINVQTIANTQETAYTTAQAIALINAGKDLDTKVYVKGIVSKVDKLGTGGGITYWISEDGKTNAFEMYYCMNIDGEKFESAEDIEEGASIIAYGPISYYEKGDVYEMNAGKLVTYVAPVHETATITLNAACHDRDGMIYGTYSNASAWVVPNDLIVYEVFIQDNKLSKWSYDKGDIVPANTGVLVAGADEGDYNVELTSEEGVSVLKTSNFLYPSSHATLGTNYHYYRLSMHDGKIGFYWGANDGAYFNAGNNKAFLAVPAETAQNVKSSVWFTEEEDAIKNVEEKTFDTVIYDMQGRKVSKAQKGLYIVNGKKYMVK